MCKKLDNKRKNGLIKQILGEFLFPLGFNFVERTKPPFIGFYRKYKDVGQKIEVRLKKEDVCYINFRAYASNIFPFTLTNIEEKVLDVPTNEIFDDDVYGWKYTNEMDFIKVLKMLRKHLELYFLPELNRQSEMLDEIRVTTSNYMYLQENLEAIIVNCRNEWGINNMEFLNQLEFLTRKIEECKGGKFVNVERVLANIAAVYGDVLIEKWGGVWSFLDFSNNVLVDGISGKVVATCPLECVINVWKGEGSLIDDYNRIRAEILTAIKYPRIQKKYLCNKINIFKD